MGNRKRKNPAAADAAPSKEALTFASALAASGITPAAMSRHAGVAATVVYQWQTGKRPIPAARAPAVAKALGIAPESISRAYAETLQQQTASGSVVAVPLHSGEVDPRRPDLIIRRLENDVDSLRYAVASLVSVMVIHRPAEAADAARAIRRQVPARFVEQGFLKKLLEALDQTGKAP